MLGIDTAMNNMCSGGSLRIVEWLVEHVDNTLIDVKTVLHHAIDRYDYDDDVSDILCFLLERFDAKNIVSDTEKWKTLMEKACYNDDLDLVKLLTTKCDNTMLGIDTAMNNTCSGGSLRIFEWLVEHVDNTLIDVKTVLHNAIDKYDYDILCFLLERFDAKNIVSDMATWKTLMKNACRDNDIDLIKLLTKKLDNTLLGIDTAMHNACSGGSFLVVEWLVEHVDNTLIDIKTALHHAINGYDYDADNSDILCFLFKRFDAKKIMSDTEKWQTVMRIACYNDDLDLVKLLTEKLDNTLLGIDTAMHNAWSGGGFLVVKWLVEHVDNTLIDVKTVFHLALDEYNCDADNSDILCFLLERFDAKKIVSDTETWQTVMRIACYKDDLDLVKLLTEKLDNTLIGIDTAMYNACSGGSFLVVEWLVEHVDNTLIDIKTAFHHVIDNSDKDNLGILYFLLKRFDAKKIVSDTEKWQTLMKMACYNDDLDLVKLLTEKLDNTVLVIDTAMNYACSGGSLRVVEWLVENVDNALIDAKTAFTCAIVFYIASFNSDIIVFLLQLDVTNSSLDREKVKMFIEKVCYKYDIDSDIDTVKTLLFENIDNTLIDVKTALSHAIYNYIEFDAMNIICFLLRRFEVTHILSDTEYGKIVMKKACSLNDLDLVKFLTEKIDNTLLGFDTAMHTACLKGSVRVVKWLVEYVDNTLIDVKTALYYAIDEYDYESDSSEILCFLLKRFDANKIVSDTQKWKTLMEKACYNNDLDLVKLLTEKIDNNLLGIDTAMNTECSKGNNYVVIWLLQNVAETLLDMNTAMSEVCLNADSLDLAKTILNYVDGKEIDMNTLIINACSNGNFTILAWLLQNVGSQVLDLKTALNISCLNGHFTTVQHILERFDIQHFDLSAAMIKVCRSQSINSLEIGNFLWNKFNHNLFDIAKAMTNACRYGNLRIANWLLEWNDVHLFDMSEALCSACQCDKGKVVKWIISNIPTEKINVQKAIKNTCRNNSDDLSIIEVFVKSSEKLGLDLNILVKEACTYERTDVIEWMLRHCDKDCFRILDLLTSLVSNDTSPETHVIDRHDKSEHESNKQNLILKILKDNTLASFDYNSILIKASFEGWIDIFEWIITKIGNAELDITNAVNKASQNGRRDIIDWSLLNLNPDQIDTNTILVEASGFGWTEIVMNISNRSMKNKIIFRNAMNDACAFGRAEVVIWLLKNNAKDMFDLSAVMNAACINGWMDTLNWILENTDYMLLNLYSAVTEACAAGNINIVQLFFNTFGNVYFDQQKLSTRLCEKRDNEKVVLFLLENLNAAGIQIDNILIKASAFGWLEVVRWIMEYSPEINAVGAAFKNACVNGEIDIVKCLQDKISEDNIQTGLWTACTSGFEEIVEVLLDSVKHEHLGMATVLNEACRCGEQTVVELLLRKVDNALFDKRAAINEACKSKLPEDLVYFLIKDLQNNDFDNEVVSENARKHRWTKILMQLKRKP
ncbi:unnamed protein product [Mytilus coruscus]|uniref:Ankyrin repeat protein n=1 Tax=Mytilus coruscus TaxID=42192 RepID=A0A6J8ETT2_MYTCO|nr:unnamed protein product [Mytilus coruscus]